MTDQAEVLPTKLEICQIAFDSLLEIIGPEDLDAVITGSGVPVEMAHDNAEVTAELLRTGWASLQQELQERFGAAGAAGIAVRTGEVLFKNFYRQYGAVTFLDERDFLMQPKPVRIRRGLEGLADYQQQYVTGAHVTIDHDADNWYWKMRCQPGQPACAEMESLLTKVMWGMVIEFITWTAGGKKYAVHERNWEARNTPERVIEIRKKYLD